MTAPVTESPPIERFAEKGQYFEAFEPGRRIRHKWGKTITQDDAIRFATQTMNHNPLWFNVAYAQAHGHPDVVVCPWYVFNLVLGMSVEDISEQATALLGYGDVVFHTDVYPGTTVTAESVVVETRASKSKPDQGILKVETTAYDEAGRVLVSYRRTNLIRRQHPLEDTA